MTQSTTGDCRICKGQFNKVRPMQIVCSVRCAKSMSQHQAKTAKKKAGEALKERKERLKTRSDYIKEAQVAFNAFVRERDRNQLCICCDKPLQLEAVGGGFDCGHYRSVGSAPHLRFNEFNAHGQSKQCNRYGSGRAVDYRIGLIKRIGLQLVEALEADNLPAKLSIDDLKAIKATYRAKLKQLKAAQ